MNWPINYKEMEELRKLQYEITELEIRLLWCEFLKKVREEEYLR
jgi:hypothetical protein